MKEEPEPVSEQPEAKKEQEEGPVKMETDPPAEPSSIEEKMTQ